jgi:hypothetical protein
LPVMNLANSFHQLRAWHICQHVDPSFQRQLSVELCNWKIVFFF